MQAMLQDTKAMADKSDEEKRKLKEQYDGDTKEMEQKIEELKKQIEDYEPVQYQYNEYNIIKTKDWAKTVLVSGVK